MKRIVDMLPAMLSSEEAKKSMTVLPAYDRGIVYRSPTERLIALNDIYDLYLAGDMSIEIYTKLYLALYRSLQKKDTKNAIVQSNELFKIHHGMNGNSVIGGADCLAIVGDAGIGKSRTLSRVIDVIAGKNCIVMTDPYRKIIPCISVQTPFDSSVKSLLLEILRSVDMVLNTKYYEYAMRSKATTDNLIGTVSSVALQHIGMIIVDEIQNCIKAKQGRNLVGTLTQLINAAGVAIVMVGTPESEQFFESEMYLARRTQGLHYGTLQNDDYFREICLSLFHYRYVTNEFTPSDDIIYWLYEKCRGNISVLVSLIHDTQEIAILDGTEVLNKKSIQGAYDKRLESMHVYLTPKQKRLPSVKKKAIVNTETKVNYAIDETISETITTCKREAMDPIPVLLDKQLLEEITV